MNFENFSATKWQKLCVYSSNRLTNFTFFPATIWRILRFSPSIDWRIAHIFLLDRFTNFTIFKSHRPKNCEIFFRTINWRIFAIFCHDWMTIFEIFPTTDWRISRYCISTDCRIVRLFLTSDRRSSWGFFRRLMDEFFNFSRGW